MKFHLNRYKADIELTPTTYGSCIQVEYHRDVQNYFAVLPVRDNCEYRYDAKKNMLYCSTDFQSKGSDKGVLHSYFVYSFEDGVIDAEKSLISIGKETKNGTEVSGQNTAIHLAVKTNKLTVKMAESYISYEQAEQNLKNDSDYNSFDELKERNEKIWNSYLSRIKITADEDITKTFYSCMYRVFLYPHKAYEIDKNGKAIHYAPSVDEVRPGVRYTDNGFWDTYRTVYPLYSLIAKEEYKEIMEGYIVDYIDGGWLPRWTAMVARACMPSSLIDAVIADAAVKGILTGDLLRTAFEGMEKHANNDSDNPGYGREKVAFYLEHGYVPCDNCGESVNKTLDAAYGDWCIGVVANILGENEKAEKYFARSKNYKNIFDAETGFMRAKKEDGTFRDKAEDFSPIAWGRDYTEAAAWQTSFAVQHDYEGLAELYGGKDKLIEKVDALFAAETDFTIGGYIREIHEMSEAMNENYGQCFMSNQPSFHLPFIFSYLGQPEKTSYWVKKICEEGFSWRDDGFPGDEDNGTSAAWYIFACLGIYPLCPGKNEYVKFEPIADKVEY
jgi:predicted alpha-1,2-mannosidase